MPRIVAILAFVLISFSASASHLISAELTYEYVGDSNYLVRMEYVRWCGGTMWNTFSPPIPSFQVVSVRCNTAFAQSTSFLLPMQSIKDFPVYSNSGQNQNSCGSSGSSGYTGFQVATYDTVVNLGAMATGCDTIRLSYTTGARVSSVNVLAQPSYHTFCLIDLANPLKNSSVKSFKFDTPAAFLDSSDYSFSLAMFDLDGDSLTYTLESAYASYSSGTNTTIPVNYASGYQASNPINNFTLNGQTGHINFSSEIPTGYAHANYVLNLKTSEWNVGTGNLIQETYRDVQFFVLPYSNNVNPEFQSIDNVIGAKQLDTFNLRVCAKDTFSFDVTFSDADALDSINVFSNLEFIADYYQITQSGTNPTTATIHGVINKAYDYGIDVIVKAYDTHNPMMGQTSRSIHIQSIGPSNLEVFACYNDWDTVETVSDSISNWSVLIGDTISATSFNCINSGCTQAELHPFNNTTYLVENVLVGGCSVFDTIDVYTDTSLLIGQASDTASNPIVNSKVYRFQYDSGLDSVYLYDSTLTDAFGFYSFVLGIDSFLLKLVPDSSNYPNLIPTYYDGQSVVPSANFIYPQFCDTLEVEHVALNGVNPGGAGFISGIVSQGAGRGIGDPIEGVELVLINSAGIPTMLTKTNANGRFKFEGLFTGEYQVFVDQWGIDNALAPKILLTVEDNEIDSLQFVLYSNRLELVKPVGIELPFMDKIQIYPNPASSMITVRSELVVEQMLIRDYSGRILMAILPMQNDVVVDIESIPSGMYLLELQCDAAIIHRRSIIVSK